MTLFRSTASVPITFDAGDTRYTVPPGEVCEIEKRYAYLPSARGLPLVAVDRKDVGEGDVVEGVPVPPPKRTRVRGVASGRSVLESDDGEDRVGEPISEARAALLELAPSDDGDAISDEGAAVPAVVAKAARARRGEG